MNDAQLRSIIDRTNSSISRMSSLNGRVTLQAEDYIHVNTSDSGRTMQEALHTWTHEFHQIVAALNQLNQKVDTVRRTNFATDQQATAAAQHPGH
jgi:hypothetical protein